METHTPDSQPRSPEQLLPSPFRTVMLLRPDGSYALGWQPTSGILDTSALEQNLKDKVPDFFAYTSHPYAVEKKFQAMIYVTVQMTKRELAAELDSPNHFPGKTGGFRDAYPHFGELPDDELVEVIVPLTQKNQHHPDDTSWHVVDSSSWNIDHNEQTSPYDHIAYSPFEGTDGRSFYGMRNHRKAADYLIYRPDTIITVGEPLRFSVSSENTQREEITLPGVVTGVVALPVYYKISHDYASTEAQELIAAGVIDPTVIDTTLVHLENLPIPRNVQRILNAPYTPRDPFITDLDLVQYSQLVSPKDKLRFLIEHRELAICQFGYDLFERFVQFPTPPKERTKNVKGAKKKAKPEIPTQDFRDAAITPKDQFMRAYYDWCVGKISRGQLDPETNLYHYPPAGRELIGLINTLGASLDMPLSAEVVLHLIEYYLDHPELALSPLAKNIAVKRDQHKVAVGDDSFVVLSFPHSKDWFESVLTVNPADNHEYALNSTVVLSPPIRNMRTNISDIATLVATEGAVIYSPDVIITVDNFVALGGEYDDREVRISANIRARNIYLQNTFALGVSLTGEGNNATLTLDHVSHGSGMANISVYGFRTCTFNNSRVNFGDICHFGTFSIFYKPGDIPQGEGGTISSTITCDTLTIDPRAPLPRMENDARIICKKLVIDPPSQSSMFRSRDSLIRELHIIVEED